MLLGVLCGFSARHYSDSLYWVLGVADFVSTIFLRLLKMIIVPLVISSIVTGVLTVGDSKKLGYLGSKAFLYYLLSSLTAILVGLLLVNLIKPGEGLEFVLKRKVQVEERSFIDLLDIFIRMIPSNFIESASKGQMLSIIFFSLLFGAFLLQIKPSDKKILENFFKAFFKTIMKMTQGILVLAPIGIWGLVTKLIINTGFAAFIPLAWYTICVLLALFIHAFISLPLLVFFVSRKNPYEFLGHMKIALLTAFSTASSSATLPVTIENIEDKAKVSNKISSFVLPLGSTINMDGTALYECVAVIFIAQVYGADLSFVSQFIIVITALLASIGAAGIPMAGLVMMSVVLSAVGLPLEGVGLIIAVDRILDMCRTTVNVWSDSCGAFILDSIEKKKSS